MGISKIATDALTGFSIFFSIILSIKLFLYLIGNSYTLEVDIMDLYHSSIGSVLFIVNNIIRSIQQNKNQ
jgi:hypothetical protein